MDGYRLLKSSMITYLSYRPFLGSSTRPPAYWGPLPPAFLLSPAATQETQQNPGNTCSQLCDALCPGTATCLLLSCLQERMHAPLPTRLHACTHARPPACLHACLSPAHANVCLLICVPVCWPASSCALTICRKPTCRRCSVATGLLLLLLRRLLPVALQVQHTIRLSTQRSDLQY